VKIPDNYIKLRENLGFDNVSLGYTTINIYTINELINNQKHMQNSCINENSLVIGNEDLCGDLIFINTADKNLPVYLLYTDGSDYEPDLIAVSFENFIKILNYIREISFERKNPNALEKNPIPSNIKYSILQCIEKDNVSIYLDFWKDLFEE